MNRTKIGLGLAAIGRPEYINIRATDEEDRTEVSFRKKAMEVLDYAYEKGIRHFDTAPSYGKGESFLIEWNNSRRHIDVELSTKWGYTYVANWNLGFKGNHEVKEHSLNKLKEQWQVSQELLPALKIYQVHSATFDSGILENLEVLNQLARIKKSTGIKIGLTTSGSAQSEIIRAALKIEIENTFLFDSFQVTYNILESSTHEILKEIIDKGKTVIIKEALANGRVFKNLNYQHYIGLYDCLESLSIKYKVGIDAIALRYVMDNLEPNLVLSGASNTDHLSQNLKVMDFELTRDELLSLNEFRVTPEIYWVERDQLNWN